MYRASLSLRWEEREARSVEKSENSEGRAVRGTRDSEFIVANRPRCDGVETRVLKAS